jgi:hypothetical protein
MPSGERLPLTSPPPTRKSSSQIGSGQPAGLANHCRFSSGSENPLKAWLGLQLYWRSMLNRALTTLIAPPRGC